MMSTTPLTSARLQATMNRDNFLKLPEYQWLETTLINSGLYHKTYQSVVPFMHYEIPKLVTAAVHDVRARYKSENNEWVMHWAIYETALKYLKIKKIDYPFHSTPQYGTVPMPKGFQKIAPAPVSIPSTIQQNVSRDHALKVENTLLQEAIQRKDQELEEKVREIEFKDEEIKKKEQYISHLLAIPAPTPIVHEIFGTDEQVNREMTMLREIIERKDQEIDEKDDELQCKDNEIHKKDRYIASLTESLNAVMDVVNGKMDGFAM